MFLKLRQLLRKPISYISTPHGITRDFDLSDATVRCLLRSINGITDRTHDQNIIAGRHGAGLRRDLLVAHRGLAPHNFAEMDMIDESRIVYFIYRSADDFLASKVGVWIVRDGHYDANGDLVFYDRGLPPGREDR
jgi:hypothetical protein